MPISRDDIDRACWQMGGQAPAPSSTIYIERSLADINARIAEMRRRGHREGMESLLEARERLQEQYNQAIRAEEPSARSTRVEVDALTFRAAFPDLTASDVPAYAQNHNRDSFQISQWDYDRFRERFEAGAPNFSGLRPGQRPGAITINTNERGTIRIPFNGRERYVFQPIPSLSDETAWDRFMEADNLVTKESEAAKQVDFYVLKLGGFQTVPIAGKPGKKINQFLTVSGGPQKWKLEFQFKRATKDGKKTINEYELCAVKPSSDAEQARNR